MSGALLAGLLAGYGVAVPVGAVAALLVSLTARTSLRVGAAAALGVATADGVYALLALLGGAALARLIVPVAAPLRGAAAVVLVALAARTALAALRQHRDPVAAPQPAVATPRPGLAYLGLLGLTLLNPMTIVYFGALVLGQQAGALTDLDAPSLGGNSAGGPGADGLSPADGTVFVAAAFAASASWQLMLACGGRLVGRTVTGRRGRLVTTLASSVVVVALAAHLAVPT